MTELEDGRWFSRAEVAAAFVNSVKLQTDPYALKGERTDAISMVPPAGALAHDLIKHWLSDHGNSKF